MTKTNLISKLNDERINSYLKDKYVPLIIYGDKYLYKDVILINIAQKILALNDHDFSNYPYVLKIKPENHKIGIDQIKEINKFIELKVPSNKEINRIVIIFNSNLMTIEAQNAFLKNLEEPPKGTTYLISSNNINDLAPTIKSRCIKIRIIKPSKEEILNHFMSYGYKEEDIKKAINISNSLPKLINKVLTNSNSDMDNNIEVAKNILASDKFNRLKLVDSLTKDKDKLRDIFYLIKQMSKFGLLSKSYKESVKWLNILNQTLIAENDLDKQVHLKTLLSDYLLNI